MENNFKSREDAFGALQIALKRSFNGLAPRHNCKSKSGLMQYIICGGTKLHKDPTEEDISNVERYLGDGTRSFNKSIIGGHTFVSTLMEL